MLLIMHCWVVRHRQHTVQLPTDTAAYILTLCTEISQSVKTNNYRCKYEIKTRCTFAPHLVYDISNSVTPFSLSTLLNATPGTYRAQTRCTHL